MVEILVCLCTLIVFMSIVELIHYYYEKHF